MDLAEAVLLLPFVLFVTLIGVAAFYQMKAGRSSSNFEFHRKIAAYFGLRSWFDWLPHEIIFKFNAWATIAFSAFLIALFFYALFVGSIK